MKQVYSQISLDEDDAMSHDYDLDEGYLFTTLKYSKNSDWADHLKGEIAGSIQDTEEDEVVIKIEEMKPLKLNYMQAQQLLILLLSNNEEKIEIRESKIIKSI
jgi:hypothetical protein